MSYILIRKGVVRIAARGPLASPLVESWMKVELVSMYRV